MAAYIDLNPVRASMVEDPKDYRFCGYGEAVAGDKRAKFGLAFIWSDSMKLKQMKDGSHALDEVLSAHRMLKAKAPVRGHKSKVIDPKIA